MRHACRVHALVLSLSKDGQAHQAVLRQAQHWGGGCRSQIEWDVAMSRDQLSLAARAKKFGAAEGEGIVRCDACPVLCRIRPGRAGACARYANENGQLVRTDPVLLMQRTLEEGGKVSARSRARSGTARRSTPRARS